jgi:hypothetical protein
MYITIDRFEGDFAVIELPDMTFLNTPKSLFPDACEGDIYLIEKSQEEQTRRKAKIKKLSDELFQ